MQRLKKQQSKDNVTGAPMTLSRVCGLFGPRAPVRQQSISDLRGREQEHRSFRRSSMEMSPVASFLRAVALLLCLCAGRSFVVLPTAHGAARRAASAPAVSSAPARSQPVHGERASSALVAQPRHSSVSGVHTAAVVSNFSMFE